ncbi:PAPA-1-like conserved region-domain-containing protein [Mucor lusitanicus]|uniref:PAPA-1-like conserved region-domain-containing protein n=1 Tax=Mucor circinelloides f. lusitanicus TaxID=29924 RepID=A0A8H4BM72_MUCCL|nr:PAPA-1-like conserved region-domain-containing protein [Mucor lusitanicus]
MRPTRKAAAKAAAAVARPISPSPISSEEELEQDEMQDYPSDLDEMLAGDNEVFSSEEDLDEPDKSNQFDQDMDSLSEQEEDLDDEVDMQDDTMDQEEDDDEEEDEEEEEEDQDQDDEDEQMPVRKANPQAASRSNNNSSNKRKKPAIPESDEDEEAIFSDDDGAEILRNKPMTKRQRAKVNQEIPEEYLELPMDTGKKKHLTQEEEQLKRSEVARRRKNQSIQRAEKDKADTINRLLKKQASKSKRIIDDAEDKETPHEKLMRLEDPNRIRYTNTAEGSRLNIPSVFTVEQIFGSNATVASSPPNPSPKTCQVDGCSKNRKYTAKRSGKFVCSLEHYKVVEAN